MPDPLEEAIGPIEEEAAPDTGKAAETTPDQLAAMRAEIAASNQARDEANAVAAEQARRAEAAEAERQAAIEGRFAAQKSAVAQALAAATNEIQSARTAHTRAMTEGNFEAATDAADAMAEAKFRMKQAEGQQRWLADEERKAADQLKVQEEQRAAQAEAVQRQPADPLAHLSAPARQWISAHPLFSTDANYRAKAMAAANYAQHVLGHAVDSPEYYEHVEVALGERQAADDGYEVDPPVPPVRTQPQPRQRTAAMAAAPSRSAAPTSLRQNQSIRLSPAEREAADFTMSHIQDPAQRYKRYAENRDRGAREKPLLATGA